MVNWRGFFELCPAKSDLLDLSRRMKNNTPVRNMPSESKETKAISSGARLSPRADSFLVSSRLNRIAIVAFQRKSPKGVEAGSETEVELRKVVGVK